MNPTILRETIAPPPTPTAYKGKGYGIRLSGYALLPNPEAVHGTHSAPILLCMATPYNSMGPNSTTLATAWALRIVGAAEVHFLQASRPLWLAGSRLPLAPGLWLPTILRLCLDKQAPIYELTPAHRIVGATKSTREELNPSAYRMVGLQPGPTPHPSIDGGVCWVLVVQE